EAPPVAPAPPGARGVPAGGGAEQERRSGHGGAGGAVRGSGVKLLGALLVIGGAAALGHLEAVRREKRARELAAVITALELLESHVVYGQVLLADALRRVGEAQPGAGWAFLRAAERDRKSTRLNS